MIPAAVAFGGGFFAKESIAKANLPQLKRAPDGAACFRISVRAVSASVPALGKPGLLSQRRPLLEVSLGEVQKDTELADYVEDDESSPEAGACARECPWHFGDTLTFVATLKDVLGPGLRFRLRAHSDILLGPVQFQLQSVADLGEGSFSLRHRILPACVRDRHTTNGVESWESPMLPVPLSHVKGGVCSANHGLGEAVAHVTCVFKLGTDPEELIEMADDQVRPVADVIANRADRVMRWAFEQPSWPPSTRGFGSKLGSYQDGDGELDDVCLSERCGVDAAPSPVCSDVFFWESCEPESFHDQVPGGFCSFCLDRAAGGALEAEEFCALEETLTGEEIQMAVQKALGRNMPAVNRPLSSPDLCPEGWTSRRGPNGRLYWHHQALGPAPWEQDPHAAASARSAPPPKRGAPPRHLGVGGAIVGPDLNEDGWVSLIGPDGRRFWHHVALGPAPWEVPREAVQRPQTQTL